jgi:hypothetical protein
MDMKVRLVSDLQSLVQQYKPDLSLRLGQKEIQVLNSPTSDRVGSVLDKVARKVGQPRGMQSNMFGSFERVTQMARDAMAMAGGDVNKAVANLEAAKQRYVAKLQAGGYDENWAISQAGPGLTAGEAVRSRQQLAEQHVARLSEQIDQAIVQLRRPARGMQGNLLGEGAWSNVKRTTKGDVEVVPTASLDRASQRNKADTSTPEYEALKASIQKKGIVDPIIITTNSLGRAEVFEGNHRLQAARELGIKEIPVVLHSRTNPSESYPVVGRKPSSLLAETEKQINEERVKPISRTAQTEDMLGDACARWADTTGLLWPETVGQIQA